MGGLLSPALRAITVPYPERSAGAVGRDRTRGEEVAMAHQFRYLFTPLRVGGLTLKNRIFSSGHAEAMAEDGKPGSRLRAYHEAKARGGAALTIIGGSTSVHPSSPASAWNMVANHDDSIVPAYRAIADAVHRHDCLIMSQLTHLGLSLKHISEPTRH
jgi:2,4-dienoyl-CoA reductase-like NADH-dependent reductase (Old Yellow Enzyme family)